MANIDRIVRVQIALRTAAIAAQSFSDLLLLGRFTPREDESVIIITSPAQLLEDYGVHPSEPLYRAALVAFSQIPTVPRVFVANTDAAKGEDEDPADGCSPEAFMTMVRGENDNWYAFCDTRREASETEAFARWAEGHEKLFVTALNEPDTTSAAGTDTTSLAARLMRGNFFRTAWWYHPDPMQFPDVAIACRSFTRYPGGETWANQRLSAVVVTPLGETRAQNVFGKNGNTFEPFRNIAITQNGKVAGGEWIDIIRFRDWLCEEIRIRVFQQMIDNRIPYTDPGIAIIRTRLTQALDMGVDRGGIAPVELDADGNLIPSYTVSVPLAANVSANNKANRLLQDVTFTARLAGAIHAVEIYGTLVYESIPVGEMIA